MLARFALHVLRDRAALRRAYTSCRQNLGRAILLGLEFLVAGDIVRTVGVEPSLRSIVVLGLVVLVRTFLSFTLEVELAGSWPWQRRSRAEASAEKAGGPQ